MNPRLTVRVRLGVLAALALLGVACWPGPSQAQFRPPIRPPTLPPLQPPSMPRPGNPFGRGPNIPQFEWVFTCSNCGKEVGHGKSQLDAPATCPFCGVRFINGGLGNGNPPAGGNPGMLPPTNPGPPPAFNPPPAQPAQPALPPPVDNPPPNQPALPPIGAGQPAQPAAAVNDNAPASDTASNGNFALKLTLGIGAVLVALLVLTVAIVFCVARGSAAPAKTKTKTKARSRRRARYDDDDDYDDDE